MSSLVLTRKVGDSVFITLGDTEVKVTLHEVTSPTRVRLQFEAPEDVKIMREELVNGQHAPDCPAPSGAGPCTCVA